MGKTTQLRIKSVLLPIIVAGFCTIFFFKTQLGSLGKYAVPSLKKHVDAPDSKPSVEDLDATANPQIQRILKCTWSPDSSAECLNMLASLICSSKKKNAVGRRLLLFGDSTMGPSFLYGYLWNALDHIARKRLSEGSCLNRYACNPNGAGRCRFNSVFGLEYPVNDTWKPPDFDNNAEGPVANGLYNHFCTDCAGCKTYFIHCKVKNATEPCLGDGNVKPLLHGGYINIEFARDVIIQSPEFRTTQENIAAFLDREYNVDILVQDFGRPVCLVNTGSHDMTIPNITKAKFLVNVEWYLKLLNSQCEHIVWLACTAPQTDHYIQTYNMTQSWNNGVKDLLERIPELQSKTAFIDVFNASTWWPHKDNIHMNSEWYSRLARMIENGVSTVCPNMNSSNLK